MVPPPRALAKSPSATGNVPPRHPAPGRKRGRVVSPYLNLSRKCCQQGIFVPFAAHNALFLSDAGIALYACGFCAGHFAGRAPVAVTNGRESYFTICDQLGTPLALANLDGHIVQSMRYDSFGNLLQAPGEAERRVLRLPLGFAGGLYDSDTGLTRFVWRDYDADTGRFTALDPLGAKGGDPDWYGYCVDDPVNRVDVWGLWSLFGVEFGGEGRPFWQPQYGNWGGKDWSGGQNPNHNGGEDGSAPSTDSADDIYKTHDTEWRKCDNADIIAENPKQWRKECRSAADQELVDGLGKLPKDPKQWIMPPATGTETEADLFRKGAQWLFK